MIECFEAFETEAELLDTLLTEQNMVQGLYFVVKRECVAYKSTIELGIENYLKCLIAKGSVGYIERIWLTNGLTYTSSNKLRFVMEIVFLDDDILDSDKYFYPVFEIDVNSKEIHFVKEAEIDREHSYFKVDNNTRLDDFFDVVPEIDEVVAKLDELDDMKGDYNNCAVDYNFRNDLPGWEICSVGTIALFLLYLLVAGANKLMFIPIAVTAIVLCVTVVKVITVHSRPAYYEDTVEGKSKYANIEAMAQSIKASLAKRVD